MPRKILASLTTACALMSIATTICTGGEELPRAHNGRVDLSGIWQALSPADWNVEPHIAQTGTRAQATAFDAMPPGVGMVKDGRKGLIPYRQDARARQQANFTGRAHLDPAAKCYLPGVPRANYMGHPLQILQSDEHLFIAYQFAQASRTVYIDQPAFEAPVESWMGHSLGRWDGNDRLIVDVTDQVDKTWLDRAGNYHSSALHVEESYSLLSPNHLLYQATLTDPETYTEPWRIEVILYRNMNPNARLLDFKCVEFVEEWMYGDLSKPTNETDDED